MPLVGVVLPTNEEYAANKPGRLPRWVSTEELLEQSAAWKPKVSNWNYELLNAALREHQERDYISSSLLCTACPRSAVLERKEDYIGTIDSMWAAFQGTMIHRTLEYAVRPTALAEWRFFTTIGNVPVSCSPDLVTFGSLDALWDWKRTENPPTFGYPYRKHTEQVQLNRYIVNHAEKWHDQDGQPADIPFNPREWECRHLVVVYLGPKGPKPVEVMKTAEVQAKNGNLIKRKVANVWSDEEVLKTFEPKLEAMQAALTNYPDWTDGLEEVWGGEPGWRCPGPPICYLPACLAKRYPKGLMWESK